MRATAIGYLRVSTDEQAASGHGLDAQRAAISDAAGRLGLPVALWFADEGIAGGAPIEKRTGLLDALDAVRDGSVLIVAKRDRLARGDVLLTAWIEKEVAKRGGRIVSAAGEGTDSDDPSSVLMRRLVDAFAEYEKAIIAARTCAALRAKRAKGEKTGGHVPYGFDLADDGVNLIENAAEQAVIARIVAGRRGGRTYGRIARGLNDAGTATKNGHRWSAKVVRGICLREGALADPSSPTILSSVAT